MRTKAPIWLTHIAEKRPDFASYLYYMMIRLEACKKVLKQTGSIYLHCDYRASHYLKMVMDEIFGVDNFMNEIVWSYHAGTVPKRGLGRKHDIMLFYAKNCKLLSWNTFRLPIPEHLHKDYTHVDENGRRFRYGGSYDNTIYYLDNGRAATDVWTDINIINKMAKERTGYPTQKPVALLERVINASSNEGDVVLDPFCGCGTTILAAQKLNRRWIGIDINRTAYDTTKSREQQLPLGMTEGFATANYVSRDLEEVKGLSPNEFEYWVNEYHRAYHPSPDRGIDGITKDGVPIQTKTWEVGYSVLDKLLSSAQIHPEVPQPVKKMIIVSQIGFDDSARATKFAIETKFGIEVELKIPEDLLE